MTALATTITNLSGVAVNLGEVTLSTTNTIKLRFSDVETVMLPGMAEQGGLQFVLALSRNDTDALSRLATRRMGMQRMGMQRMMEQAVAAAMEPFNFVAKRRSRLRSLQISPNVTGFTAHHLQGEVKYTMATGFFKVPQGRDFQLRLLVTAQGRDMIEDRVTQKSTQRALFSINEGAYLCRPQWEPPPPPPGMERGKELSEAMFNAWLQTYLGKNDGLTPNRMFQRPVGMMIRQAGAEELESHAAKDGPPTVVRLLINGEKALEVLVVLGAKTADNLRRLSRSGQERFLGDLFRALFSDSARLWESFGDDSFKWHLAAVKQIPADAIDAVTKRLEGGGLVLRQLANTDEGHLEWMLGITPHAWQWMMRLAAAGMAMPGGGSPNRQGIFRATGWGKHRLPWVRMVGVLSERDLQDLMRLFQQARVEPPTLAAVAESLDSTSRTRWLESMPVMLRERTEKVQLDEGEGARLEIELTRTMVPLARSGKLPPGRLNDWVLLYAEFLWGHRQHLIEKLLPLRHLVYGMDRTSLSRLLFDVKSAVLTDVLCWAEFPVVDQVRRAISPSYAVRLLEDIAVRRPQVSAYAAQEAQMALYTQCALGCEQGLYLLRPTPFRRLNDLLRLSEGD